MNDEIRSQVVDEGSTVKPSLSPKAIISFIAGIGTYVWFFVEIGTKPILTLILAPIIALVAIFTGARAKKEIRNSSGLIQGKKLANAGLFLGYFYIIVGILLFALILLGVGGILSAITGLVSG